ncbi:hypothetical protein [Novosphingobium sp.]|uniref:hypothetical protein n=1 Tax=Novosphingobium sp. TaxID=1874826 RepID=UPI00286C9043|nr:hypothetical protein [Novosphingobium sp.]
MAGAALSSAAALLHLGVIVGGPDWYRFFGAGEDMAQAAARGEWGPAIATLGISAVLLIWAAYAWSGAGRLGRPPFLRTGLVVITGVYLVRALILIPLHLSRPELTDAFMIWSSLIVLVYGLAYAIGTWRAWPHLRPY